LFTNTFDIITPFIGIALSEIESHVQGGCSSQIVVDKSKKYQQEKGEWKDPESIVKV